jgi:hypothetical protein
MKVVVLFLLVLRRSLGFFVGRNVFDRAVLVVARTRNGQAIDRSSLPLVMGLANAVEELISYIPPMEKPTELWLDLRGSATHPEAAVQYILDELEEVALLLPSDRKSLIDKVMITDRSFQSLVYSSDPFVEASEILYHPEGSGDGYLALSRNSLSLPFGNVVVMPDDNTFAVSNPMDAMRLLGDGWWIILENEKRGVDPEKEPLRIDAISSFLDIAATSSTGIWSTDTAEGENGSDGRLILKSDASVIPEQKLCGGVAVSCCSKSFFVQLASVLRSFPSGSSTTMSESGIIIQETSGLSPPSIPTALILPFDMSIWKAALMIYGHSQFQNLVDDD